MAAEIPKWVINFFCNGGKLLDRSEEHVLTKTVESDEKPEFIDTDLFCTDHSRFAHGIDVRRVDESQPDSS